MQSTRR